VARDGHVRLVPAAGLVPGDVVLLGQGDVLAADLRLVEAVALRVNEAALTGESEPASKVAEPLPNVDPSLVAERRNMAFRGTAVTGGRGRGVVVATGMATELGRVAELLQAEPPGPTPLQRRLSMLAGGWRWPRWWCVRWCSPPGWPEAIRPTRCSSPRSAWPWPPSPRVSRPW
jgi:Ca2+-transporting ATPase